jgi:hypothetical protein
MDVSSLINQIKEMMDTVFFQIVLGVLVLCAAVYLYFVPFAIAYARRHKYTKTVFLLNLLFGWTGLGWIVLVVWAFAGQKKSGIRH